MNGTNRVTRVEQDAAADSKRMARPMLSRRFLNAMPDIGVVIDESGVVVKTNDAASEFFGLSHDQLSGAHVTSLLACDQWGVLFSEDGKFVPRSFAAIARGTHDGVPMTCFSVEVHLGGLGQGALLLCREAIGDEGGPPAGQGPDSGLGAVIDELADVVIRLDRNLRLSYANRQLSKLLPRHKDDYIGRPLWQVGLPIEVVVAWGELVSAAILGDSIEVRDIVVTDGGATSIFESRAVVQRAPDGSVASTLLFTRDVTQQRMRDRQLRSHAARMQILSRMLIDSQETERNRIALELHDEIGQHLTAAKLMVRRIKVSDAANDESDSAVQVIDQLLRRVRELSLELRPLILDDLGLDDALAWLVGKQMKDSAIKIEHYIAVGRRLPRDLEIACFRVVQEALTNAIRHAAPTHIVVKVTLERSLLKLLVSDDGKGIERPEAADTAGRGLGLMGMKERIDQVGGAMTIMSAAGRGTRVSAEVPVTEAADADKEQRGDATL